MKIIINTPDPEGLKERIVSDVENGNLPTWELRTNVNGDKLLTHAGEQWVDKVLLRMTSNIENQQLIVETRHWSNVQKPSEEESGTVLGRFSERLFVQYASLIEDFVGVVTR